MSRASSSRGRRGVYVEAPTADIYTVLLGIALGAIFIACLVLALELNDYGWDAGAPTSALPAELSPTSRTEVAMADGRHAGFVADGQSWHWLRLDPVDRA